MPIYEYRNPATGETIEMIRPAYQRDILPAPGWERVVSTPAPPELRRKYEAKTSVAASLAKGLRKAEDRKDPAMREWSPTAQKRILARDIAAA